MIYLSEKNRIAPSAVKNLITALADPENTLIELPVTASIARAMQRMLRDQVSDMPDRIIAATAVSLDVPIISRDSKIRSASLQTIW